jgi:hypothetical protein
LPVRSSTKPNSSFERVAVGLDGAGAGPALSDHAPQEEVLHELAESDLWCSHDTPAGGTSQNCDPLTSRFTLQH